jgi:hypothetical protein
MPIMSSAGTAISDQVMRIPPRDNVTVPVGVPVPPDPVTVAVNVTASPATDGLADEVTVVTVTPLGDARALGAPRIAPDITTHPATAIFTQAIFGIPLSVPAKGPGAIVRIAEVSAHRAFAWGARSR